MFNDGSAVAPTGPVPSGNGYAGIIYGPTDYKLGGALAADWIIQHANGKPVSVAYFDIPTYSVLAFDAQGAEAQFHKYCPKTCTLKSIPIQVTAIGTSLPQTAVATIQSDRSIGYLLFPFGGVDTGVLSALQTAGLNNVKLAVAASLIAPDYAEIASGTEAVGTNTSSVVQGDMLVDELARYLETKKPVTENPPIELFDQANAPANGVVSSSQYKAEFRKALARGLER